MHDIPPFGNHLPVRVRFGEGVAATLPDVLAELGSSRVFLMVDEGIEQHNPAVADLLGALPGRPGLDRDPVRQAGRRSPPSQMVDDATRALVDSGATALVAIGGGSVIDTAKAARLCAQLGLTFAEFLAAHPATRCPRWPWWPCRPARAPGQRGVRGLGRVRPRGRPQERHRQRQPAGPVRTGRPAC